MTQEELNKRLKYINQSGKKDAAYYVKKIAKDNRLEQYPTANDWYKNCLKNFTSREDLKTKFGYTEVQIDIMFEHYHEAFWQGYNWWQNKMVQVETILAKYKLTFEEAEKMAQSVDVSDIKDGFPCGSCTLYLKPEAKNTDLGKALRTISNCDSYTAKVCHWSAYELPVKIPSYGQCIDFDERICKAVAEFLTSKDIPTGVYSWID